MGFDAGVNPDGDADKAPPSGRLGRHADVAATLSLALSGAAVLGFVAYVFLAARWSHEQCGSLVTHVVIGLAQGGEWLLLLGFLVGVVALLGVPVSKAEP
jgi:hypothetical protein